MEPDLSLDDAVRRWQTLREQGKTAGLDEICAEDPEKTVNLCERLRAVASLAAFLGLTPELGDTEVATAGDERTMPGTPGELAATHDPIHGDPYQPVVGTRFRILRLLARAGWATSTWPTTPS